MLQSVVAPQGFITVLPKDVGLTWIPPADTGVVSAYNLYYDTQSRFENDGTWPSNYLNVISIGNVTNAVAIGLRGGTTYWFAVAGVDEDGIEGLLSPETHYTTPVVMDVGFDFKQPVANVTLQWSPDMKQWNDLGNIPTNGVWRLTADPAVPRFYRGKAVSQE